MVCHALLQGIFPTWGLKPGLLHCRWILYHLSCQGLRIPGCLAYPSSRGTSWSRNRTRVSCTAGRFFTTWAIREAHRSTILLFFKKSRCGNNSAGMVVESREELLFSALAEHTGVGNLWKVHPCVGVTDSWLSHPRDNHVPHHGKPPLRTCPSSVLGTLKMYSITPAVKLSPGFCTSVFFNDIPSISGEAREVLE